MADNDITTEETIINNSQAENDNSENTDEKQNGLHNNKKQSVMFKWWICIIAQVIAWTLMTIEDYIDETGSSAFFGPVFIGSFIVCLALYFFFRKKIYVSKPVSFKEVAGFLGRWVVVALATGIPIYDMACVKNTWIVYQNTVGWENLLNSIEYPIFAIWMGGILALLILLIELAILCIRKIREQ